MMMRLLSPITQQFPSLPSPLKSIFGNVALSADGEIDEALRAKGINCDINNSSNVCNIASMEIDGNSSCNKHLIDRTAINLDHEGKNLTDQSTRKRLLEQQHEQELEHYQLIKCERDEQILQDGQIQSISSNDHSSQNISLPNTQYSQYPKEDYASYPQEQFQQYPKEQFQQERYQQEQFQQEKYQQEQYQQEQYQQEQFQQEQYQQEQFPQKHYQQEQFPQENYQQEQFQVKNSQFQQHNDQFQHFNQHDRVQRLHNDHLHRQSQLHSPHLIASNISSPSATIPLLPAPKASQSAKERAHEDALLAIDFNDVTVSELKDALRSRGKKASGKKDILIDRLKAEIHEINAKRNNLQQVTSNMNPMPVGLGLPLVYNNPIVSDMLPNAPTPIGGMVTNSTNVVTNDLAYSSNTSDLVFNANSSTFTANPFDSTQSYLQAPVDHQNHTNLWPCTSALLPVTTKAPLQTNHALPTCSDSQVLPPPIITTTIATTESLASDIPLHMHMQEDQPFGLAIQNIPTRSQQSSPNIPINHSTITSQMIPIPNPNNANCLAGSPRSSAPTSPSMSYAINVNPTYSNPPSATSPLSTCTINSSSSARYQPYIRRGSTAGSNSNTPSLLGHMDRGARPRTGSLSISGGLPSIAPASSAHLAASNDPSVCASTCTSLANSPTNSPMVLPNSMYNASFAVANGNTHFAQPQMVRARTGSMTSLVSSMTLQDRFCTNASQLNAFSAALEQERQTQLAQVRQQEQQIQLTSMQPQDQPMQLTPAQTQPQTLAHAFGNISTPIISSPSETSTLAQAFGSPASGINCSPCVRNNLGANMSLSNTSDIGPLMFAVNPGSESSNAHVDGYSSSNSIMAEFKNMNIPIETLGSKPESASASKLPLTALEKIITSEKERKRLREQRFEHRDRPQYGRSRA